MVNLPQYGGEWKEHYKGNKSDQKLVQHGGEGTETDKKSDMSLKLADSGPGVHLKQSK